ncbi:hypothetical protein ACVW01_002193 [Thermostichus sp. MS-CIW-19]|jgi:hypothetical protein|uniref:hypothetical protein n=1 Tax=Synechococcus sp. 'PEA 65AY6A-5F PE A' TaxID=1504259 RepID=UPI00006944C7|nr:hypothetical protein CYA_1649 [Synechococcus sp. JA-3-3Ab]PIK87546.1 hypothetical protein SYN63AY4M2_13065 [Synechococcus sp. 63AY4M2]PIK89683.1 hypothetical protein SYN65AY6A5_03355 [Synechococcus sp. 65AY6A5]PIK93245.1 hypothetical protein SYN65AY6LI_10535 [Synechococcus sp. 65AY6Li]PIK96323.1 hypothetical protein SYN60AY4M2_00095 [Synechococcus sp. 60AY4M2]PIK99160.1 hypothetical protein SYN63AY4M1_11025 [Synechococcus sp. 63AY4M1]PIL02391.1 hypothetical protein SYN65AY640_03000 [Synech
MKAGGGLRGISTGFPQAARENRGSLREAGQARQTKSSHRAQVRLKLLTASFCLAWLLSFRPQPEQFAYAQLPIASQGRFSRSVDALFQDENDRLQTAVKDRLATAQPSG